MATQEPELGVPCPTCSAPAGEDCRGFGYCPARSAAAGDSDTQPDPYIDAMAAEHNSEYPESTPAADPVSAPGWLTGIKARVALVLNPRAEPIPVPGDDAGNARLRLAFEDAPALVAALEAVLAEADRWEIAALRLDAEHERISPRNQGAQVLNEVRAELRRVLAKATREAIESALRDAQGGGGQPLLLRTATGSPRVAR